MCTRLKRERGKKKTDKKEVFFLYSARKIYIHLSSPGWRRRRRRTRSRTPLQPGNVFYLFPPPPCVRVLGKSTVMKAEFQPDQKSRSHVSCGPFQKEKNSIRTKRNCKRVRRSTMFPMPPRSIERVEKQTSTRTARHMKIYKFVFIEFI